VLIAFVEKLTYFNAATDFGSGAKYYIASYRIVTSRSHRYVTIALLRHNQYGILCLYRLK